MLSRNLVVASIAIVFLATAVSAAPVEDKEPEENDFEAEEGEEELSEEEEDDDDSKGQHMKGAGAQQATKVPKGPGVTVLPGISPVGEPPNGHKVNGAGALQASLGSASGSSVQAVGTDGSNGKDSQALPSSSHGTVHGHGSSGSKVPGAAETAYSDTASHGSSSQVALSHVSSGQMSSNHVSSLMISGHTSGSAFVSSEIQSQTEEAATTDGTAHDIGDYGESQAVHLGSQIEAPGSESILEKPETGSETETNGNGHKHLINGQETGHAGMNNFMEGTTQIDLTGGFDSYGSNLEMTGIIDHSSHDFLIGLMGGIGDGFSPDPYTDTIADHMGLNFQVESTGAGLDPGFPAIISSAQPAPHAAENGPAAYASVTSDNGAQLGSPGDTTEGADNNGADSPNINGNGRLRPVPDIHKGDAPEIGIHLYTTGEHQGLITQTDTAETLDVIYPTASPVTKIPSDTAVTSHTEGVGPQTDVTAGLIGEPVTNGHKQINITIMADSIYSSRPSNTLGYESTGVTEGIETIQIL
ncbi:filaggrin-2 isoform X1 [Silurus meridionalis]|uniref:filaggrin-2 isoform X1 n=1 Tax=Silurus meridionalis TaxID=175797 RepID=UPI001EEA6577|nr:filaggrin-2 isoform X1 [Silurus meridionalis]XP_046690302.1 filaggrin-2 isoform X1 [Silurus meridionalis]XP_046690303.1 filaggrin-2 isoform X1 [Silurus meridionalis]